MVLLLLMIHLLLFFDTIHDLIGYTQILDVHPLDVDFGNLGKFVTIGVGLDNIM